MNMQNLRPLVFTCCACMACGSSNVGPLAAEGAPAPSGPSANDFPALHANPHDASNGDPHARPPSGDGATEGATDGAAEGAVAPSDASASDSSALDAANPRDASDASPDAKPPATDGAADSAAAPPDARASDSAVPDASNPHDASEASNGHDADSGGTHDASSGGDSSQVCNCTSPATCGGGGTPGACGYSTTFAESPLQMPISEGGIWWNGQQTGKLWSDVYGGLGRAYGAPTNTTNGTGQYADPTAILEGSWNPNQKVTAKVFCSNNVVDHINYPEVELRLRFTISADVAKGYEIMWRCSDSTSASLASSYLAIAAWLGGSGQFSVLTITLPNSSTTKQLSGGGVQDGDTVSAAIYGSTISLYRNGQLQGSVNDTRFTSGNPGIGFNYVAADNGSATSGYNADFGFTSFSATELLSAP